MVSVLPGPTLGRKQFCKVAKLRGKEGCVLVMLLLMFMISEKLNMSSYLCSSFKFVSLNF